MNIDQSDNVMSFAMAVFIKGLMLCHKFIHLKLLGTKLGQMYVASKDLFLVPFWIWSFNWAAINLRNVSTGSAICRPLQQKNPLLIKNLLTRYMQSFGLILCTLLGCRILPGHVQLPLMNFSRRYLQKPGTKDFRHHAAKKAKYYSRRSKESEGMNRIT